MPSCKDWPSLKLHAQQLYDAGKISYNEWYYGGRQNTTIGYRTYPYRSWQGDPVNAYQNDRFYNLFTAGYIDEWEYAKDMRDRATVNQDGRANQYGSSSAAPRHSRWAQLEVAVDEFLKVLEETDQEERVSMITFNSSAQQNLGLTGSFTPIRDKVASIKPKNSTNVSDGMLKGLNSIKNVSTNPLARPYAAKTIVVLTDGIHNTGTMRPPAMATQLINDYNVVIHTVTFSKGVPDSSKNEMKEVARIGSGRHYHADTGEDLVRVFQEIANNLPTIITE